MHMTIRHHALPIALLAASLIGTAHAQSRIDQVPTGSILSYAPQGAAQVVGGAPQPTSGVQIVREPAGIARGAVSHPEFRPNDTTNVSNGNVAGLLSYCIRSGTLDDTTTRHTARVMATRPDVRTDQNYALGGQGLLRTTAAQPVDLATLSSAQRTITCRALASRGRTITG